MKKFTYIFLLFFAFCKIQAQTAIEHIVQEKETLYGISKKYNITVETLQNNNKELLTEGLKKGQVLKINTVSNGIKNSLDNDFHTVVAKESLYSIARLYNVAVLDLEKLNQNLLINGLKIGQKLALPNRKKTIDGQARIINSETVFHEVLPKETKYSISKKYGITIEQLEIQNPEIVNNLNVGNKLAINSKGIKPNGQKEELMLAVAEKQVAEEHTKSKNKEVENLKDALMVQKEMNQKVIKVNNLSVNLNDSNYKSATSSEKLKLVIEANKNIQDILVAKLDSLVLTMNDELETLKKTEILDLDRTIMLEKDANDNMDNTKNVLYKLKKDLTDNRKNYSDLMFKAQKVAFEEQKEYKKKLNQNRKATANNKDANQNLSKEIFVDKNKVDKTLIKEKKLLTKIDSLTKQKNIELKRRIQKANFYSAEAREYDDRIALAKIKRYKTEIASKAPQIAANLNISKNITVRNNAKSEKELVDSIKIIKNLSEVKAGFYLVVNTYKDAIIRDKKIMELIKSGLNNASFIYDFNILSYYVYTSYSKKLDDIMSEINDNQQNPNFENVQIVNIQNE